MANTAAPSMDTAGWVIDGATKLNRLLAWFFTTMNSQSTMYNDSMSSIQSIMEKNGNDMTNLVSDLQRKLINYLGRYYDSAGVLVFIDPTTTNMNKVTINLEISISDNNGYNQYGPTINLNNGIFGNIVGLNN